MLIPKVHFQKEILIYSLFYFCHFIYGEHYFFKAEQTYSEWLRFFVMVRRELHIYIYLQQSTFKKGQIYAKIYLYIYLELKIQYGHIFLRMICIQLCIFPYKACI